MKILAIETSGVTFSAALSEKGRVVSEVFWPAAAGSHSETLIPAVNRLLKRNGWKLGELDRIAVSTGPGSFTGIRVGLTFARTAAQNLGLQVAAVNTLDVLAGNAAAGQNPEPAIDALRNEVYVRKGGSGRVEIESVDRFLGRLKKKKNIKILGSAAVSYAKEIRKALGPNALSLSEEANYPRAGKLAVMAESVRGQDYQNVKPLYVRRSWAEEKRIK